MTLALFRQYSFAFILSWITDLCLLKRVPCSFCWFSSALISNCAGNRRGKENRKERWQYVNADKSVFNRRNRWSLCLKIVKYKYYQIHLPLGLPDNVYETSHQHKWRDQNRNIIFQREGRDAKWAQTVLTLDKCYFCSRIFFWRHMASIL